MHIRLSWAWIGRSLLLRRRQVIRLAILTFAVFATGLAIPISVQRAVDHIVAKHAGFALLPVALAAVGAIVAETYATRGRRRLVNELGMFLERRIARLTFTSLLRARLDQQELRPGDALTKLQQTEKIVDFILHFLPTTIFDIGGGVAALALMAYYDLLVASIVTIAIPLFAIALSALVNTIRDGYAPYFEAVGRQKDVLAETVHGLATVKVLAVEGHRTRLFSQITDMMLGRQRIQMDLSNTYMVVAQLASRLLTVLVVGVGCWRLWAGAISVGDLLALQLLAARISGPMLASGSIVTTFQQTSAAIEQINLLLQVPRDHARVRPPARAFGAGGILIRGVALTYPGAARPALAGLDLDLPERGVVALVGRNGSGKSTLVSILLGLRKDYSGRVEIGGRDIRDYDPRWLRSQYGVVNQDTVLFSGSIRDNVTSGRPVDDAPLRAAMRFADADRFVDALPDGADTEIKAGSTLSGGQRQRLAIARAMIRDPRIAIFDEPGAFLDAEAAVALERRLSEWAQDRLVILVTHHLLATRTARRIIVLDEGKCVGNGTHEGLLATSPQYATLWADYNRHETETTSVP